MLQNSPKNSMLTCYLTNFFKRFKKGVAHNTLKLRKKACKCYKTNISVK